MADPSPPPSQDDLLAGLMRDLPALTVAQLQQVEAAAQQIKAGETLVPASSVAPVSVVAAPPAVATTPMPKADLAAIVETWFNANVPPLGLPVTQWNALYAAKEALKRQLASQEN